MRGRILAGLKAVGGGVLVGVAGTLLGALVLAIASVLVLRAQGLATSAVLSELRSHPPVVAAFVLGLVLTVLSGFVAGRIAKSHEVTHAALTGVALFVVTGWLDAPSSYPAWFSVLACLLTLPCAVLGGLLARARRTRMPVA